MKSLNSLLIEESEMNKNMRSSFLHQPGYYPGYSTLAQKKHWDDATQKIIESRLALKDKPLVFFSREEADVIGVMLECLMPQSDRDPAYRIPVLQSIDQKLFSKQFDGYFYAGCPEDDMAYRIGIQALAQAARDVYQKEFSILELWEQESILISIKEGKPVGNPNNWEGLPPSFFWARVMQDAVSAYYAHPYAWDEIGFGGPAYPRGYMRLTEGKPEPWEKDEVRYKWTAPVETRSDTYTPSSELFPPSYNAALKQD